jgi:hypothetical protein
LSSDLKLSKEDLINIRGFTPEKADNIVMARSLQVKYDGDADHLGIVSKVQDELIEALKES